MAVVQTNTDTYKPFIPEKVYEGLYSKVGVLYFLLDSEGNIISFNVTVQERLGYEKNELRGKKFLSVFCEKAQSEVEKIITQCLVRGYVKDVELCMTKKNGKDFSVLVNALTENDSEGNPKFVRFYVQDISEITRIKRQNHLSLFLLKFMQEETLSERLLKEILSEIQKTMSSDGLGIAFSAKNGKHFLVGQWRDTENSSIVEGENFRKWLPKTWKHLLDVCRGSKACSFTPAGSLWTGTLPDLILEMQPQKEKDHLLSLAEFESLVVIPIPVDRKIAGYFIMVNQEGQKWDKEDVEFLETIVPIFSKIGANKSSVSFPLEKEINSILNVSIAGILVVENGIIKFVNHWIENFLELPQQEIRGKPLLDFIDPEYREKVLAFSQGISQEQSENQCEAVVLAKDENRRQIKCSFVPLSTNGRNLGLWYWISKNDNNQQQLQKQLFQARKMESLGLLAGGIVHDFNNLLACILGYSSLLSEEISKDSPYYDDVQQIVRTSEKATELTSRLLAYAQGASYIVNALDVNQLVKEIAAILSRTLDKNITIRAELDPKLSYIKADASQVQQAILQVALNARDAMPNGGKLFFQTRDVFLGENNAWLRFGGKPGRYVQIAISDTGLGMDAQIKERIFEPYFTTKTQTGGKGIGLSIVREIVEKHGGFISVFSEKAKGTVFKIHFPAVEKRITKSIPLPKEKPPLGKETILLVDDEKVLRETARKMLTRYGYKVISAENGTEAIAIYKKYLKRIDLIILDLLMPGMEINKVFAWLKKLNPKAKIIATSGVGEKESVKSELQGKIAGFVEKPFQVRPLLRKVRSVLNA